MRVRISDDATEAQARAIAEAMASQYRDDVTVVTDGGDELGSASYDDGSDAAAGGGPDATGGTVPNADLGPTAREEALLAEIDEILEGGPEKYRDQLPEQGKLFVRDRIDLWFGDDFHFEDGKFAAFDDWHPDGANADEDVDDRLPADGDYGRCRVRRPRRPLHGQRLHGQTREHGRQGRREVPPDATASPENGQAGAVPDGLLGRPDRPADRLLRQSRGNREVLLQSLDALRPSPQICVLYGPCIAGAAYTPVFADFTVMVRDVSAMAIASPRMVEMVTGEEIALQELGGPDVHAQYSGSADLIAEDEEHARELVAQLIGYLPDNSDEKPPRTDGRAPADSPAEIDAIVPQEPNKGYDMFDVIDRIVDSGSTLELRSEYGPEIITAFARIDGRPVGIVANQPAHRAGAIFPDAAEKAAQFIWTCDAYDVPLLYLCDTPGFMAGSQVEKEGILEQGKKMIYATSSATVPKQSVVVRKAYGAGIYAMSGPAYDPESVIGLPSGEIAIMGPEAAINAVYARKLAEIDDEEERERVEQELREEYREDIDIHRMASEVVIDEIVPPSDLREELTNRFAFYENVEKDLPDKKHGTIL